MKDKIKADILNKYHELKEQLGHKPSRDEFVKLSGFNEYALQKVFGSNYYSKLMKEGGDEPNVFFRPARSTEEFLIGWGNIVRQLGKIPTVADWVQHNFKPAACSYQRKFGPLSKMPGKFTEFAKGKKEWDDVLELLPKPILEQIEIKNNIVSEEEIVEKSIYQFLPPVLNNLCELGISEGKNIEFEKKVNLAFQILGFKVRFLGQGSGRNPDGIAYDAQNHYAIIYDAKARKDGYSFGTDDRTIIEYINAYKNNLLKDGFEKIYFLIVSNKFNVFAKASLNKVVKATGIPVVLVKTEDLLNLVSKKIRNPIQFDLGALQDFFVESGELDQKKIEKIVI
jgi:hypothetical protein